MLSELRNIFIALGVTAGAGLALLPVNTAAQEVSKGGVTVVQSWARATAPSAKSGAAFGEIKAASGDRLVAAKSSAAKRVEIHNHVMENGVARMRRVDGVAIEGGKSVTLHPHGYHIMLIDLVAPLKQGETLPLTLVFEKAGEITMETSIQSITASGPHGSDHASGHSTGHSNTGGASKH
jgi:copper(I)-binding protein